MSIRVISRVLPKLWGSPSRKIVAIKLADVANDDGTRIYPSIFTVASEAELSKRQVQRIIDEFRKAGLLIVVRPGGGRNRPTEYRFDLEAIDRLPDARPTPEIPDFNSAKSELNGQQTAPEGSKHPITGKSVVMENGDMVSPFKSETVTSATGNGDMGVTQPVLTRKNTPYGEASASLKGGAKAPTTSSQIWTEALSLLSQCPFSESQKRTLIGKWQKRTPTDLAKKDLLAAVRAAARAGTLDPIRYVEAALRKYPVPPDPASFTDLDWRRNVQAAIKTKQWAPNWGPAPGKRGCRVPSELITPQLTLALAHGASV
jgi:hypothetical protein